MTLGSLFDGISGFPLAASWAGIETKWISEIDPYCLKVSKKNFPNAIQYGDIKEIGKGKKWEPEPVDIISGGFPCQPFSVAGKQQGKDDDRFLWPEMLRVIREVKPRWVIGENVPGIIHLALDEVLTSLEDEGYKTETFIIPACSKGAPHKRDRVWIVANSIGSNGRSGNSKIKKENTKIGQSFFFEPKGFGHFGTSSYSNSSGFKEFNSPDLAARSRFNSRIPFVDWSSWPTKSGVCGRNDGIPNRVDRIKALGNAIVPQIAYEIFKAIIEIESNIK